MYASLILHSFWFQELKGNEYVFFHALLAKKFWPTSIGFPYDQHSEPVSNTKKWLESEQTRYIERPTCVYATLIYAASILSYLRNRDFYSTEAIFHDDLIKNPHDCVMNLCAKLGIDFSQMENVLLPFNAEVSMMIFTMLFVRQNLC